MCLSLTEEIIFSSASSWLTNMRDMPGIYLIEGIHPSVGTCLCVHWISSVPAWAPCLYLFEEISQFMVHRCLYIYSTTTPSPYNKLRFVARKGKCNVGNFGPGPPTERQQMGYKRTWTQFHKLLWSSLLWRYNQLYKRTMRRSLRRSSSMSLIRVLLLLHRIREGNCI